MQKQKVQINDNHFAATISQNPDSKQAFTKAQLVSIPSIKQQSIRLQSRLGFILWASSLNSVEVVVTFVPADGFGFWPQLIKNANEMNRILTFNCFFMMYVIRFSL